MQLPAFLRSIDTVVLPCKGGRKTADTAPPPLPLSSLPLPFPSPWVVQAQAPLRGALGGIGEAFSLRYPYFRGASEESRDTEY